MSDIAPDIFPFLVAALEDERRECHCQLHYRMMDLGILHRFLLLELIPRVIGRHISAFETHCERLISQSHNS